MHYYSFSFVVSRKDKQPQYGNCIMRQELPAILTDFVTHVKAFYAGPDPYEKISIPKWEEISEQEYFRLKGNE